MLVFGAAPSVQKVASCSWRLEAVRTEPITGIISEYANEKQNFLTKSRRGAEQNNKNGDPGKSLQDESALGKQRKNEMLQLQPFFKVYWQIWSARRVYFANENK